MKSIKSSLYSNLINQGDSQNKGIVNQNSIQSIQDQSHNHSKILKSKLNPISSSLFSIETSQRRNLNPKSILDIISPKSTSTQFDSKVLQDPFEFFGQQRSQFIQRDLIQSNQHSNLTLIEKPILKVDEPLSTIHSKVDHLDLSKPTLLKDSIKFQLDDLTNSFEKSTQLFNSDLKTPIQSFKKFRPLRLHSRIMNQSITNQDKISSSFINSNQTVSKEIMNDFLSPSYSIEEENQKVKNLIIQEIQLSSNHSNIPILSFKGEPISNTIKSNDSITPLISRKRKPSDLIDESDDHHSNRIKISNHSKNHFKINSNHLDFSIPSLHELRATMPASSRRYYQHTPITNNNNQNS